MEYLSNGTLHGYLPNVLEGLVCVYSTSFNSTKTHTLMYTVYLCYYISKDWTSKFVDTQAHACMHFYYPH